MKEEKKTWLQEILWQRNFTLFGMFLLVFWLSQDIIEAEWYQPLVVLIVIMTVVWRGLFCKNKYFNQK